MDTDKSQRARIPNILYRIRSNEMVFGVVLGITVGVISGFGAIVFRWLISTFQSIFFGGGANYLGFLGQYYICLLYTSPSPRDRTRSRMPSSA